MATRRQTTILLTDDDDNRLDEVARRRGDSRSAVVRQLIREHLDAPAPDPLARSSIPKSRA